MDGEVLFLALHEWLSERLSKCMGNVWGNAELPDMIAVTPTVAFATLPKHTRVISEKRAWCWKVSRRRAIRCKKKFDNFCGAFKYW